LTFSSRIQLGRFPTDKGLAVRLSAGSLIRWKWGRELPRREAGSEYLMRVLLIGIRGLTDYVAQDSL
jgi:hypothetical protein